MAVAKKNELTPMMKQYMEIKSKNPHHFLFYRLGDFYEMFFDDAVVASKVLGLTLTTRGKHMGDKIPLAGFPHHHLENYLSKMVKAGYRVAVCDQTENPKFAKGVVKRDIVEIVTAGTALSENIIESDSNNYIAAISFDMERRKYGFSVSDVSTGEFLAAEIDSFEELLEVVLLHQPSELIVASDSGFEKKDAILKYGFNITILDSWKFDLDFCLDNLLEYYKLKTLKSFGFENEVESVKCAGVILYYIKENLRSDFKHLTRLKKFQPDEFVGIDENTRKNLELLTPISSAGNKNATLFSVLKKTKTGMGSRLLKRWIVSPIKSLPEINSRLDFVEYLLNNKKVSSSLSALLGEMSDIERLTAKISTMRVTPTEMLQLKSSLELLPRITELFSDCKQDIVKERVDGFADLDDCIAIIASSITEDAPINLNLGGFVKAGYNKNLDELRDIVNNGKDWILDLQNKVREEIGVPSLKVGFNRVFGYYFEVTRKHSDKVPDTFIRKQTLANADRFINEELKVLEEKVLNAGEKIKELEKDLLFEIRNKLTAFIEKIKFNSEAVARIDCLASFAVVSQDYNFNRPELNTGYDIDIKKGRHPVVESLLPPNKDYVPNDLFMDSKQQILIITGPNMSGKSTYLRQAALITLMAQMGCFVPAEYANIGLVDKIFTRVGASDNLAGGESTFLVEMNESANILNNATGKSLIVFDEVGRGTSTFDGLSLAWSIVEYIHNNKKLMSRTLFATHYHELTEIEKICPRVKNYSVSVKEYKNEVIFMRKIVEGGADHSYGIHVAKLAGLPDEVINRANEILTNLEKNELTPDQQPKIAAGKSSGISLDQISLFSLDNDVLRDRLAKINVNNVTPLQAINLLSELKDLV